MGIKESKVAMIAFYRAAERRATVTVGGSLVFGMNDKREIVRLMKLSGLNGGALANILITAGDYGHLTSAQKMVVYNRIAVRLNTFRSQIQSEETNGVKTKPKAQNTLNLGGFPEVQPVPVARKTDELSIKIARLKRDRSEVDTLVEQLHEKLLKLDANITTLEAAQKIIG